MANSQFYEVMEFLDEKGYHIVDKDGDWAHRGGHTQDHLASVYSQERAAPKKRKPPRRETWPPNQSVDDRPLR